MYQVPSEFIRQKATVIWFLTVEHAVAAFAGYLLAHALGGGMNAGGHGCWARRSKVAMAASINASESNAFVLASQIMSTRSFTLVFSTCRGTV